MRNKFIAVLTLLVLVAASSGHADGLPPLSHSLTPILPPYAAPTLRLMDMDDALIDIQDLKGKVVLVNFWATWCPPCRREMASLERLHQASKDKVVVLAINIGEDEDTIFAFMGTVEPSPNFQILYDPDGDSMAAWKVRGLPTTFLIDPDGNVVYRAVGGREFDHPELLRKVTDLNP